MTVKVKRKVKEFGQEFESTIYLPENVLLTRHQKEKADRLDTILKSRVQEINREFDSLDRETKEKDLRKWRWLGEKIDYLLREVKLIEQKDIDTNVIWPAIGQHLRPELKRGYEDIKRSGTKKDHYRKCWALAILPGTGWFTSWVGWDAFTDRGEQLVYSKRLMPLMEAKFSDINPPLNSRDFQLIAKIITRRIPSKTESPADIDAMSENELKKIVDLVYREFVKLRGRRGQVQ